MMIVSVLLSTIAGLIKSLTPNYISYVIMEFLDTAIGSGMYSAAYILGRCNINYKRKIEYFNSLIKSS